MLEIIEKLLVLQDRDRRILHVSQELSRLGPERETLQTSAANTQKSLDAAKMRVKKLELDRKQRDVEIEAQKTQIEKYLNQQLQTRKNEEYKALTHQIETAKAAIFKIEDAQIALMEQAEAAQKDVVKATAESAAAKKLLDDQIGHLNQREANLKKELAELQAGRKTLAEAVAAPTRSRYERLFKHKGENVIVGIEHGACGGCHMKLTAQEVANCRAQAEIVTCTSCSRILYFTPDMDLEGGD
jgi:predicted  nucleic acid-binding Zn-ribbon protein